MNIEGLQSADVNWQGDLSAGIYTAEPEEDVPFVAPPFIEPVLPQLETLPGVEVPPKVHQLINACVGAVEAGLGVSLAVNGRQSSNSRGGAPIPLDILFLGNDDTNRISLNEVGRADWLEKKSDGMPQTTFNINHVGPDLNFLNGMVRDGKRVIVCSRNILKPFEPQYRNPVGQSDQAVRFGYELVSRIISLLPEAQRFAVQNSEAVIEAVDERLGFWAEHLPADGSEQEELKRVSQKAQEELEDNPYVFGEYNGAKIDYRIATTDGDEFLAKSGVEVDSAIAMYFTSRIFDRVRNKLKLDHKHNPALPPTRQLGWYVDPNDMKVFYEGRYALPEMKARDEIREVQTQLIELEDFRREIAKQGRQQIEAAIPADLMQHQTLESLFELYRNGVLASYMYGTPTEGQARFTFQAELAKENPDLFFGDVTLADFSARKRQK